MPEHLYSQRVTSALAIERYRAIGHTLADDGAHDLYACAFCLKGIVSVAGTERNCTSSAKGQKR